MQYFIDTNVFIRFFVPDKFHQDCKLLLAKANAGEINIQTSNEVLAEVVYVLGGFYGFPKAKVANAVRSIAGLPGLSIKDKARPSQAINLYEKNKAKFVDCLISSCPEIAAGKTAVVSYDKDFDKLDVKRVEPKSVLGR